MSHLWLTYVILLTFVFTIIAGYCGTPSTLDYTNVGNGWDIIVTAKSSTESRHALDQYNPSYASPNLVFGRDSDKAIINFARKMQIVEVTFYTKHLESNTFRIFNGKGNEIFSGNQITQGKAWLSSHYTVIGVTTARSIEITWVCNPEFTEFGLRDLKITVLQSQCDSVVTLDYGNIGNQWFFLMPGQGDSSTQALAGSGSHLTFDLGSFAAFIFFMESVQIIDLCLSTWCLSKTSVRIVDEATTNTTLFQETKSSASNEWTDLHYKITNAVSATAVEIKWLDNPKCSHYGFKDLQLRVCADFCSLRMSISTNEELTLPPGFHVDINGGPNLPDGKEPAMILLGSKKTVELTGENYIQLAFESPVTVFSLRLITKFAFSVTVEMYGDMDRTPSFTQTSHPKPWDKFVKTVFHPLVTNVKDVSRINILFQYSEVSILVKSVNLRTCVN